MKANIGIDGLTVRVAAGLLLVVLAWLLLGIAAALLVRVLARSDARRSHTAADAIARRALPRWLYALLAGSAIALVPVAAQAVPSPSLPPPALPVSTAPALAPPTRAPAPPPAAPGRSAEPTVTVRPADSLWRIAGRELGPSATETQIAAAWPRWYAANRSVIGTDPGLIRPGQHLHPPTAQEER